jgi:SH3-like domain-containing protein
MQNSVMKSFMTRRNAAIFMAAFCLAPIIAFPQATPPAQVAPALAQFISIGDQPAIFYDSPSGKANKIFILFRHTPLEVLVKLDKWTKARDSEGNVGWIENSSVGSKRHAIVFIATADIRAMPLPAAPSVFDAQRGVLLEITGPAAEGWLPVRHRDGQAGFVRLAQMWGV